MDGEILISLKERHTPTAEHMAALRRELPEKFHGMTFFFQPADIVNQVLNFGQQAPIDIRISGPHADANFAKAKQVLADLRKVPGVVDAHIFQVPDAPSIQLDVDRTLASEAGMSQREVADNVLVTLSSSAMVAPNFWLSPSSFISYPLVVQTPTYHVENIPQLVSTPLAGTGGDRGQLLMQLADVKRTQSPMVLSQVNIKPVFDVHADVQGRDLGAVAKEIDEIVERDKPSETSAMHITVTGQIATMRESFHGLAWGIGMAVVLVFLLMVINFQSWLDPIIVLMAVPCALVGVMWMLLVSQTHISVPALMGSLMCIGLTTANSILVVSFANQRMEAGDDALTAAIAAGYTRLRPVLMTAGAMVLGMVPMALGLGEGGEQNAPLGRAVIGGLIFATFATLIFVPAMYRLMRGRRRRLAAPIRAAGWAVLMLVQSLSKKTPVNLGVRDHTLACKWEVLSRWKNRHKAGTAVARFLDDETAFWMELRKRYSASCPPPGVARGTLRQCNSKPAANLMSRSPPPQEPPRSAWPPRTRRARMLTCPFITGPVHPAERS